VRIGIDVRELGGRATGLGRYLAGLLGAWQELPEMREHELLLFSAKPVPIRAGGSLRVRTALVPGAGDVWWEQLKLASAANHHALDVFFAPGYTAPLRLAVPLVLTIHDVSFVAHPEWFGWREGTRRRTLTRLSARKARTILTVSDFSRAEIVAHLGVPADAVRRVYNGFTPPADALPGASDPRELLVLYAGTILSRRHVPDLVRAFRAVAEHYPRASLAIVGDNRTYPREDVGALVRDAGLGARVMVHDYADEGLLANLYHRARVFVFLSEYEGFGLTPLEALSAGVPSVLLDTPVAREVFGRAAAYVEDTSESAVATAIEKLLVDGSARQSILAAAPAVLARFSWTRAGRETLDALVGAAQ
jgi:glycosyltransferase involved in cell wall biosynthesis